MNRSTSPWLIESARDGSLLVLVPGGKIFTGERDYWAGGCAPFWVEVPSFYLGLHPVTNAQYQRFVQATGHPPPRRASTGDSVWQGHHYPPELADHPVVYVTWHDAEAYCNWAGLRLPRELEWERGARGDGDRVFTWGDDWDPDLCRNDLNRGRDTTASVWSYPAGTSSWGCYQMLGNVWEWCVDWFDPGAYRRYARGDLTPPSSGRARVTRGGSWFNVAVETFRCGYRWNLRPEECDHSYGFRVARDA